MDVRQVNLAFKVEGRIESLTVDEGDRVEANQLLATLDKRYFEDELRLASAARQPESGRRAARARLAAGRDRRSTRQTAAKEATLAQAKDDYARYKELEKFPGAASKQDIAKYAAQLAVAEADVKYALESQRMAETGPRREDIDAARAQLRAEEASVSQAERRLADSDLFAPGAGEILTRARERGAIVSAGETVFTLTLSSPVWVRTYVNEIDLGRVQPDMAAFVRTDSAPAKIYKGHVGFISPTAEFTPKSVETRELRTDLVYRLPHCCR